MSINADLLALARPIAWFKPDPKNARKHSTRNVKAIADSLRMFGQQKPVVALEDGTVIAGNGTLEAAKSLGMPDLACVVFADAEKARAFAIADNRTAELAEWDVDALTSSLKDLVESGVLIEDVGFSADESVKVVGVKNHNRIIGSNGADDVNETPESKDAVSKRGEVYELGPHRLVCGDVRDAETLRALLENKKVDCVWTDPPYGVSYVGGKHEVSSPEERKKSGGLTLSNDELTPDGLEDFLRDALGKVHSVTRSGASWYVCAPSGPHSFQFSKVLLELGVFRQLLTWVKSSLVLGRSNYHYRHELVFYGWTDGAGHYFTDDRTRDSVLEFDRPSRNKEHPTMKPVELIEQCLFDATKPGWVVLDPFGGSGSTLMACHNTGRVARLSEIEPRYADVIRRRWTRAALAEGIDPGSGALEEVAK